MMAKQRVYITLDPWQLALLRRVATLDARCPGSLAKKLVLGRLYAMTDLDPELRDYMAQWENDNFGKDGQTWQATFASPLSTAFGENPVSSLAVVPRGQKKTGPGLSV